ncbi:NAD binding Rossmann fold oxidoreductase, partial [Pelagophyceae sp. CCMP2097]
MAANVAAAPPAVLMLGTGEYTTGWVGKASDSDKSTGVVGLVTLDLKQRGKVGRVGMCGTNGTKLPAIRAHMQKVLGDVYEGIDPSVIETFPADDVIDRKAFGPAISTFKAGDCAIIFTPDDTHFEIAMACIAQGLHVLITKPPVKTLAEHAEIAAAAKKAGVLVVIEVHKRYDPIYRDARDRIRDLGNFSFFQSYMSQPKHQLETFKAWAGVSSDISYYLNSHHVDFCEWVCRGTARPEVVTALRSTGVANAKLSPVETEDTITLAVQWRNLADGSAGHALYTSSWIAAKTDVHSQQHWFYMGTKGEVRVDQAHRGYTVASDDGGFGSHNPLFWKPTPSNGKFVGQPCYGYRSFEGFIDAAHQINTGAKTLASFDEDLPTMNSTAGATAILEAGRRSLDAGGKPMMLVFADETSVTPIDIKP